MEDIVCRLARSCAHGTRQLMFVNELIAGVAFREPVEHPKGRSLSYGESRMVHKSWLSLKRRLAQNGFYLKIETNKWGREKITLEFSG